MIELPTYKGYTIDFRLGEFRKVTPERGIEFLPFKDDKGDKLLSELIKGKGGEDLQEKAMEYMRLHS